MYYYIIEPLRGKFSNRPEKIKDILGNLGIAGESVSPSAARSIEELTHLGVLKGYSTIVAVGSEALVNKVLTVLATDTTAKDTVLGFIPNDFETPLVKRLGFHDLNSACEALKARKLENISLGLIEPNKYFLTEAVLDSGRAKEVIFSMDKISGLAKTSQVVIKPGLQVTMYDTYKGGPPKKFFNWLLGKKERDVYTSSFETRRIRFEAERENLPIRVSGETVAKTPATFSNHARLLKIIVARDRMREDLNSGGKRKSKS